MFNKMLRFIFSLTAGVVFSSYAIASQCSGSSIQLYVLGSGGPEINDGRNASSYLVTKENEPILLLDVGSGSHVQFDKLNMAFSTVEAVLLSHLHTDHSADLPTFVKGSYFTNRNQDLMVAGPKGNHLVPSTEEFVDRLFGEQGAFSYLRDYLVEGKEEYLIRSQNLPSDDSWRITSNSFEARAIEVGHGPIPALAWKINIESCQIVYLGDTSGPEKAIIKLSAGADLLIMHNAIPEFAGSIAKRLHMTPSQLVSVVKNARPKQVLLSHFMNRSRAGAAKLAKELSDASHAKVTLAEDGLAITLGQ